jgi:metal-sulfur cluster biosynthetic enzyme
LRLRLYLKRVDRAQSTRVAIMNDQQLLTALAEVLDPELGMNIVDFGLVYRAERTSDGIVVEIGVPPTCPATQHLADQARQVLCRHFPNIRRIEVSIQMDKFWSPDRLTENGRREFFRGLEDEDSMPADDRFGPLATFGRRH